MDSEISILHLVEEYIKKFNINQGDFEGIKPRLQEQLLEIEGFFQKVIDLRKEIAITIRNNKLNVSKVAITIGLSRTHINNNKHILKRYIQERIDEIDSIEKVSLEQAVNQKNEAQLVKEWLGKVKRNFIDIEIFESKIRTLEAENRDLYKRIHDDLEIQVNELRKENEALKHELRKLEQNKVVILKHN